MITFREAYEEHEIKRFTRELREKERGTLSERRESANEYREALLTDLEHVARQVNFLLNGDYGYGALAAYRKLSTKMNRAAWLFKVVGALNWHVPEAHSRKIWRELSEDVKASVNAMLEAEIRDDDNREL